MSMKNSCTSWYDQYHSISKTIYGNHLKSTYFKDNLQCLILPQPFFFLIFVPGISFQHQLMGSPGNSPGRSPSPTASRFTFKSPSGSGSTTLNSPAKLVGEQNPRNNYPLWFFIVGIRIVQLVSSEGIQLNISTLYGTNLSHLERRNVICKSAFWREYVCSQEGNMTVRSKILRGISMNIHKCKQEVVRVIFGELG